MNRRNVLGNRIEESKTLWVVAVGIFVTAIQFAIYHFISEEWLGLLLVAVAVLFGAMLVHLVTKEQEEMTGYLLIPCTFSGAMGLLLPYIEGGFLLSYGDVVENASLEALVNENRDIISDIISKTVF